MCVHYLVCEFLGLRKKSFYVHRFISMTLKIYKACFSRFLVIPTSAWNLRYSQVTWSALAKFVFERQTGYNGVGLVHRYCGFGIFLVTANTSGEGAAMKPTLRRGKQTHILCVSETRCVFLALPLSWELPCIPRFGSRAFILGGGGGEEFSVWKQEVSVWAS